MKRKKIAKLAAEISKSLPGSTAFLRDYKAVWGQVNQELSNTKQKKYEAMAKEWTDNKLPLRMQQRYVFGNDSLRLEANLFTLV